MNQSIWIRISHRFGPRMTEWVVAFQTLLWGAILLLPEPIFDRDAWSFFRSFISEDALGGLMLFLGALRLLGLIINGARKRITPQIRVVSATIGACIWAGISYSFWQSGVVGTWIAIYPVIAAVELINIYRAAHDVGESYGTA